MTLEKYNSEVETLYTYCEYFCLHNHTNQQKRTIPHIYKEQQSTIDTILCDECLDLLCYSLTRLQNCPYEEKPRCRKCKTPCYEKSYWKRVAKVMIYSSLRLTLTHIKDKYFF